MTQEQANTLPYMDKPKTSTMTWVVDVQFNQLPVGNISLAETHVDLTRCALVPSYDQKTREILNWSLVPIGQVPTSQQLDEREALTDG